MLKSSQKEGQERFETPRGSSGDGLTRGDFVSGNDICRSKGERKLDFEDLVKIVVVGGLELLSGTTMLLPER